MTKQTIKSVNEELQITKDFLINKVAELESRLDAFTEQTVRAGDYLANRVDNHESRIDGLAKETTKSFIELGLITATAVQELESRIDEAKQPKRFKLTVADGAGSTFESDSPHAVLAYLETISEDFDLYGNPVENLAELSRQFDHECNLGLHDTEAAF